MEENEIFEEVYLDDTDEIVDGSELVDTVEEVESVPTYNQDDIVSALLYILNEQKSDEDSLDQEEEFLSDQGEDSPIVVQNVDTIDYTALLVSIDERLENVETLILDNSVPDSLDTPLNEYSLSNILLVLVLGVLAVSFMYSFVKDNLLHI